MVSCVAMRGVDLAQIEAPAPLLRAARGMAGKVGADMTNLSPRPMQMALTGYYGSQPLPLGRDVLPFHEFPSEHQAHIAEVVAQPTPPARWLGDDNVQIPSRAWYEWHWARGIDPDRRRQKIPSWMREFVIERDGLVCQLCFGPVERSDIHIDHIVPVALGGPTEVPNLQVSHSLCNTRKGARVE